MAEYLIQDTTLTALADCVRKTTGVNKKMSPDDMAVALNDYNYEPGAPDWIDDICFWDYDGSLILQLPVKDAANLTELPTPPNHNGLVFQEWNYTLEEIQDTTRPLDVGATYITADGNTHVTLNITDASYLAVPIHFQQDAENGVTIDWGDGMVETLGGTGAVTKTHTYAAVGKYEVVLTVQDGCTMTLGGGTSSTSFIGGDNSTYRKCATAIHIGYNAVPGVYGFNGMTGILYCTIPIGISSVPDRGFYSMFSSDSEHTVVLSVPRGVTTIGMYGFSSVYGGVMGVVLSLPSTVLELGNYCCYNSNKLRRIIVPNDVTELPSYFLYNAYALFRLYMGDKVTTINDYAIANTYFLSKMKLSKMVTTIAGHFLYNCHSMSELIIPKSLVEVGSNFCNTTGIVRMIVEGTPLTLSSMNNTRMMGLKEVVFLDDNIDKTVAAAFASLTYAPYCLVYVPDNKYESVKTYVSKSNQWKVRPLSEYRGKI